MNKKAIKILLNESEKHIKRQIKIASKTASQRPVSSFLLKEAEQKIAKIKEYKKILKLAQRTEKSMDIKNSVANTVWWVPSASNRIKQIEENLKTAFQPYFPANVDIQPNAYIPANFIDNIEQRLRNHFNQHRGETIVAAEEKTAFDMEPQSTLRIEFRFKKQIKPVLKEFAEDAEKSLNLVDEAISKAGISQGWINTFIRDIESLNIPLAPYYHKKVEGEKRGGKISNYALKQFIKQEHSNANNYGFKINPIFKNYFSEQLGYANTLSNVDDKLELTLSRQSTEDRYFSNDDVFNIRQQTYLFRAIKDKIMLGYRLNKDNLRTSLLKYAKKMHDFHSLKRYARNKKDRIKFAFYEKFYGDRAEHIIREYEKAISPVNESELKIPMIDKVTGKLIENQFETITCDSWGNGMRGIRFETRHDIVNNKPVSSSRSEKYRKSDTALDFTLEDLQFLLQNLNDYHPNLRQKQGVKKKNSDKIDANSFRITGYSLTYDNNGFDSNPDKKSKFQHMLLFPAMKLDPVNRWVIYDTDSGNLGRNHMFYYGNAIGKLIQKHGEIAQKALLALQNSANLDKIKDLAFRPETDPEQFIGTYEVLYLLLGSDEGGGNRTNAENVIDMLLKYPDYDSYMKFILKGSLASSYFQERNEKNKLIRLQREPINPNTGELLDYNTYMQLFNEFNTQGGNVIPNSPEQFQHRLNKFSEKLLKREDFDLFKQYGYAIAKMMDFVFALMIRSCEEAIPTGKPVTAGESREQIQTTTRQEAESGDFIGEKQDTYSYFYGRNYSSSTGKAEFSKILFGVKYAFNAPELGSQDDQLVQIVRRYKQSRHLKKTGPAGEAPFAITTNTSPRTEGADVSENLQISTVARIKERMTFWTGYATSTSRFCKTISNNETMYTKALSKLLARYPSISEDLGVIFEPISIDLIRLRIAADSALTGIQKKLSTMNMDIVIEDNLKRTRVLEAEAVEAARIIYDQQAIEASNSDNIQEEKSEPIAAEQEIKPEETETIPQTNLQQTDSDIDPDISTDENEDTEDTDTEDIQPEPRRNITPPITDVNIQDNNVVPDETSEDEANRPRPMPMNPEFVSKTKKKLFVDRNNVKIKKSELIENLVKLSNKLDSTNNFDISDKIDRLLKIL